jgi:hypothetical protein
MVTKDDLIEACTEYLKFVESDEWHEDSEDDYEHHILEVAMEFICGDDVWDRINKAIERHEEKRDVELRIEIVRLNEQIKAINAML